MTTSSAFSMKIVLDSNVLISSYLAPTGTSYRVLVRCFSRHTVILSEYILQEFKKSLVQKFQWPEDFIQEGLAAIRKRGVVLETVPEKGIHFEDVKDIPILALLKWTRAHYLITGDQKLLALQRFETTLILNPREALEVL